MKCPDRSALAELAFATINGERRQGESAHVESHVGECKTCRNVFENYVRTVERLKTSLCARGAAVRRTGGCLDDNTLAAFVDRALSADARQQVENHLARCGFCAGQVVELAELTDDFAGEKRSGFRCVLGLAKRGLRLLQHPANGFRNLSVQPVPSLGPESAGVFVEACAWRQRAGNVSLQFTAVRLGNGEVNLSVRAEHGFEEDAVLNMRRGGGMLHSDRLPAGGSVTIRGLEAGDYELAVSCASGETAQFELGIQRLDE